MRMYQGRVATRINIHNVQHQCLGSPTRRKGWTSSKVVTSSSGIVFVLASSSSFFRGLFSKVVLFLVLWRNSLRIGSVANLVCASVVFWNANRIVVLCRPWLFSGVALMTWISHNRCGQFKLKNVLLIDMLSLGRVGGSRRPDAVVSCRRVVSHN